MIDSYSRLLEQFPMATKADRATLVQTSVTPDVTNTVPLPESFPSVLHKFPAVNARKYI